MAFLRSSIDAPKKVEPVYSLLLAYLETAKMSLSSMHSAHAIST